MSAELKKEIELEIAHVLFIDIVGYSKLLITEQGELLGKLTALVRETEAFRRADAASKFVRIPTGDGMALVFRTTPEAPVRCAMELSTALKAHPELPVRMGIHSGPINEVVDVNERTNITGAGINIAQRVMDCGDAGHILLSKHVADDLEQFPQWRPRLHDLGECEVKHSVRLHLVNLYGDEFGNPAVPSKVAPAQPQRRSPNWTYALALVAAALAIGAGALLYSRSAKKGTPVQSPSPFATSTTAPIPEKSIAVLPFENLSRDPDNAYFAEGVQDEILTKLASIDQLKVISRTSTARYKSKPEDLKTVARELGVATVLEGSVQKSGEKVRVNVQLVDARTDSHLWAKSYDHELKDVFAVESAISQEVADALQARLSPRQSDVLASVPTTNSEAYDLFLRAEYEEHRAESSLINEAFQRADALYRAAFARDPKFALAYARLAYSQLLRHWFVATAELTDVKSLIDRAIALKHDLPDAYVALGLFHYYGSRNYEPALEAFRRAVELQPNSASAYAYTAWIYRRQAKWEQSLSESTRAVELDPRAANTIANHGNTYLELRRWAEAEQWLRRSLAFDPANVVTAYLLSIVCENSRGDLECARGAFDGLPATSPVLVLLNANEASSFSGGRAYLHVLESKFSDALELWADPLDSSPDARMYQLQARVIIQVISGRAGAARSDAEELRAILEVRSKKFPGDVATLAGLAWAYVGLGRNGAAMQMAELATKELPVEKDALTGARLLAGEAQIAAVTGHADEAVKLLQRLISIPAGIVVSQKRLKIDPVWDPIRNHPGFQQLLTVPDHVGPSE